MPLELPILVAVVSAAVVAFAVRQVRARRRYEAMKMSGGRKALVRNLFG